MRNLTKKQKKILDSLPANYQSADDLPIEIWEKLKKVNNTEILYQEVNRYLWDRYFNFKFKR